MEEIACLDFGIVQYQLGPQSIGSLSRWICCYVVLDFAGLADHKKLMPRNLMGILGVANCCSIEISIKKKMPRNSN